MIPPQFVEQILRERPIAKEYCEPLRWELFAFKESDSKVEEVLEKIVMLEPSRIGVLSRKERRRLAEKSR